MLKSEYEQGYINMKTRVAFEAKKPLEIVELDLEGPKAGEVLVKIMATGRRSGPARCAI
jgi:Zn-dependent alcohol dehydrogenase